MEQSKLRILVVVGGIFPPIVECTGVNIIYKIYQKLAAKGVEIHFLTAIVSAASLGWKEWMQQENERYQIEFHYISLGVLTRLFPSLAFYLSLLLFFPVGLVLHRRYHFDIIHEYSSSPLLFIRTSLYRLFSSVKLVHTICTSNTSLWGRLAYQWMGRCLDRIICVSDETVDRLRKGGIPQDKMLLVPLGVDSKQFLLPEETRNRIRRELMVDTDTVVVTYIGPLRKNKGVFTLGRAIPIVQSSLADGRYSDKKIRVVFLIVSSGSLINSDYDQNKKVFLRIIREYQPSLKFREGKQDIPTLLAATDILVLPQLYLHGTLVHPQTLLEAMAAGKAIVASNTSGVIELIEHKKNGLLFHTGDEEDLAKLLISLIDSPSLRSRLGEFARDKINQLFQLDGVVAGLQTIYQSTKECCK